jgi:hypothetical protein
VLLVCNEATNDCSPATWAFKVAISSRVCADADMVIT